MKLLGTTEDKTTKDKNGENVSHLEIAEVVLVHCNIVDNDYQKDSIVFNTIVVNKLFGSLLEISPINHYFFLKTFNLESQGIKRWFSDQSSQPLEIEDRIPFTLVTKQ